MDDFKKLFYGVLIGFGLLIVGFVSFAFIWSCGLNFSCERPSLLPAGTPVPTLIPATLPASQHFLPTPTEAPTAISEGTPVPDNAPDIARPSNSGGPGEAINLKGDAVAGAQIFATKCEFCHGPEGVGGIPNPGTDDITVPPLNPIDSTMVSPDYKTFAYNIDLFVQHGSTPPGINPTFKMPAWGDLGELTQQQIADVIAYIISLNSTQ